MRRNVSVPARFTQGERNALDRRYTFVFVYTQLLPVRLPRTGEQTKQQQEVDLLPNEMLKAATDRYRRVRMSVARTRNSVKSDRNAGQRGVGRLVDSASNTNSSPFLSSVFAYALLTDRRSVGKVRDERRHLADVSQRANANVYVRAGHFLQMTRSHSSESFREPRQLFAGWGGLSFARVVRFSSICANRHVTHGHA